MRFKILGLALFLLSAQSVFAQIEHAPSVKQCRADQVMWLATLDNPTLSAAESFATLNAWSNEMLVCAQIDSSPRIGRRNASQIFDYLKTSTEAITTMAARQYDFLTRHNLVDQFLDEDKQGKRGVQ